jgi:hypothetical protein
VSTYTPIASVTLSSAQSSVTFSGIPQTYTDIVFVCDIDGSLDDSTRIRFNSDSATNYSQTNLTGNGSTAASTRSSSIAQISLGVGTATNQTNVIGSINNYSNSTTYKTVLLRANNPAEVVAARVGLWRSTSAITSIEFFIASGNWVAGSTFNLYGVANASITNTAKATGGDSVTTDGTYWYHTFRTSGTFTPTQALTADYLVVAGGGAADISGGNGGRSGGGGAGGLRCTVTATGGGGSLESALSLTAQAYTVTIGAGGAINSSGSNSVFSTITSTGGGKSGTYAVNGVTGGSGGGAGSNASGSTGGAGTANQGFAGGSSNNDFAGGGGGGAGAVGGSNSSQTGGAGGAGVATSITGSSVTYAGGGGAYGNTAGGAGGSGGGGTGGTGGGNSTPGSANTGGGGGGGSGVSTGTGGSGIVIVRYAV